jgi:TetR/AcrR family transcriptional regulator
MTTTGSARARNAASPGIRTARGRRARRPRDAEATRGRLLAAATAVFSEHGIAGARVDDIARRAGVNKALIYSYFGDKEGLYRAVLSSRLAAPLASLRLDADSDPRRGLEQAIRRYFRLLVEDRAFARLLAWDLLSPGRRDGERDALVEAAHPFLDLVNALAERARASGALPASVEPELLRTAVVALAVGYSIQHGVMDASAARGAERYTDEQFFDYACRLVLETGRAPIRRSGRGSSRPRGG